MKIQAATRLVLADLQKNIEKVRRILMVDGPKIQSNNESITFEFTDVPYDYVSELDKRYGPHRKGSSATDTIYMWKVKGLGINFYLPRFKGMKAKVQVFNRIDTNAALILADKHALRQRMIGLKHSLQSTPAGPEQDKIQKTIDDLKEIMRTSI